MWSFCNLSSIKHHFEQTGRTTVLWLRWQWQTGRAMAGVVAAFMPPRTCSSSLSCMVIFLFILHGSAPVSASCHLIDTICFPLVTSTPLDMVKWHCRLLRFNLSELHFLSYLNWIACLSSLGEFQFCHFTMRNSILDVINIWFQINGQGLVGTQQSYSRRIW